MGRYMAINEIQVHINAEPICDALDLLEPYWHQSRAAITQFFGDRGDATVFIEAESEYLATVGTCELLISFKPNKQFLNFLAALRTGNCNGH